MVSCVRSSPATVMVATDLTERDASFIISSLIVLSTHRMTARSGLPRAATWLRHADLFKSRNLCTRHTLARISTQVRQFTAISPPRQSKAMLDPPTIPDLTHRPRMELNEFLGAPGWKIDDLLPSTRQKPSSLKTEQHREPPTPAAAEENTSSSEITSQILHHLLQLSALPAPSCPAEEEDLLSALHDQLHFVRHIQSVATNDIPPLFRVGYEPEPNDTVGVLTYNECVEAAKEAIEKVAAWKQWNATELSGGSRIGRESGYFVVVDKTTRDGSRREKGS